MLAQGHKPNTELEEMLEGFEGIVVSIGDCQMARTCEEAVLEGLQAAINIGKH